MIYVNNAELEKIFGSSSNITFSTVQVEIISFPLQKKGLYGYTCNRNQRQGVDEAGAGGIGGIELDVASKALG